MRKAAAKLQKIPDLAKKTSKILPPEANFSRFTIRFSLLFRTFAADKSIKML
jgi:hypothetical protein